MSEHPIYKESTCLTNTYGNKYWVIGSCLYPEDKSRYWYTGEDGIERLYFNGYLVHREDGPAFEGAGGHKEWYQNGLLHRLDGPAIEYADGDVRYCIEGEGLSEEQWLSHSLVIREKTLKKINRIKEIIHG